MQLRADPETVEAVEAFAGTVRIAAVEAIPFALPYRRAPKFASGSVDSADNVLVRVHTDAGLVGQAEAQPRPYTYGETQISIVNTVRGRLNDGLIGVDPLRTELVAERCGRVAGNQVARGAVDLAVWDLVGQILGCPCHRLLGGFADDVAAAHMVSLDEPAAMANEAVAMKESSGSGRSRSRSGAIRPSMSPRSVRSVTLCRTPICTSTRTAAGATTMRRGPATSWQTSGFARSRSRSRSRTGPVVCASRSGGSCRWSAMRAVSASRTSTARSRRARCGW